MIFPDKETYRKLAATYDIIPVFEEILADTDTPVSVLQRFSDRENVFLFESMEGGEKWGRYSFIGVDPTLLLEADHSGASTGTLDRLRSVYKGLRIASIEGLPRFCGGAVGFLGYEAACEFEHLPIPSKSSSGVRPQSRFLQADNVIVFDNVRHTVKIVVCSKPDKNSPDAAYDDALRVIGKISNEMRKPMHRDQAPVHKPTPLTSNVARDEFMRRVSKAKDYIIAGDIIQTVLSHRFSSKTDVSPLQLYRALRFLNPSPYTFFLKIGEQTLVGSSPEVMVRLTGNRVELRPIAGTRPRGATEQADRALADELLADEKEKAEHVMLVDLGRNDIGRVSEPGSVQVTEYMVIERYSHVMHLVSNVEGVLKTGCDALDVIKATFPAGTLSGAPKIRAMEIIHELEQEPRGPYGGAVGYISYDGNMDLCITIRTLIAEKGTVSVQAGAGIVYDSDPAREYQETCQKAEAMRRAVEMAESGLNTGISKS